MIIRLAQSQFFHGPFQVKLLGNKIGAPKSPLQPFAVTNTVGDRIGAMIYFADIDTGLLAVSAAPPATGQVYYSRFSASVLPPGATSYPDN
jgi:hypothetical protein